MLIGSGQNTIIRVPQELFTALEPESPYSVYSFTNLCSGTPIPYSVPNTAGHSYSWSVVGGTPSPATGNSIMVTWNTSGPYSIQLTETSGSCSASSINYVVSVNPSPTPPSVTNAERCGTGTVTLVASGAGAGEDYKWYDALTGGNLLTDKWRFIYHTINRCNNKLLCN